MNIHGHVIVTLVSDQTIPNILVINAFAEAEKVEHLFVTTKQMEQKGKTDAILKATGIDYKQCTLLLIDQEQPDEAQAKINTYLQQHKSARYTVNLTGGTKLTALMMFKLFEKVNSRYCYLPIGSDNILLINQDFSYERKAIDSKLNLYSYLKACGLFYNAIEENTFSDPSLKLIHNQFAAAHFNYPAFPIRLAHAKAKESLNTENIAGTWFEEYVFSELKKSLNLKQEAIARGVYIFQTKEQPTNDQEIDLIFVANNELHLVECKVSLGRQARQNALKDLFKLAAIAHKFGLNTKLYFVTLDSLRMPDGNHNAEFLLKCKLLNITNIADRNDLKQSDFSFKKFISNKISSI